METPHSKEFSLKTFASPIDSRNVLHENVSTFADALPAFGGVDYLPEDIDNQIHVGICTSISDTQNNGKANIKKYSADFHYLLQKKYYDYNWIEGSSILNSLKVATKYGFLPAELWTHTTLDDRNLPYDQYIAKLQAVPDSQIQGLLMLCVDRIPGYASVDVTDPYNMARAILDSKAGIICRYNITNEWWTDETGAITWDGNKLCPITPRTAVVGGHAITASKFDYRIFLQQFLPNTWGKDYGFGGVVYIDFSKYKPTEAWIILKTVPALPPFQFVHDLTLGMTSPDVIRLQQILNQNPLTTVALTGKGSIGNETNFFGSLTLIAVKKFQTLYKITPISGYVGLKTRSILNGLINK